MNGNSHQTLPCPHCRLVYYSKGALTRHIKNEHWWEEDEEE